MSATGRTTPEVPAGPADPAADTTYLVVVHARLGAEGVPPDDLPALAARVADAFIARDDAATVWIHVGPGSSRVTLDVTAADRDTAIRTGSATVEDVAAGLGVDCRVVATAATTERERAALPAACPADDPAPPA